ncbi:unnamed protein product [Paramecium sonneborni]|uniref:Uncharacterized protein n=1 Tax=Paramecium sonneborni TaxID=65129 RepID=A0A8S1JWW7_9CILI|nr:unnamed protein product [Paramecium sonneborni]
MNSSKTSRTVKAMHLFHLEQRNSNLQHYNIPTCRETIPSILKPLRLSPTKQSLPTSRFNLENNQSKLSVERKISQLRKELQIAKNIKQKQLFQSNKLINNNNFSTLEIQLDKQPKLMKYFQKKSNSKIKLFEIPITIQERQIQQSTQSTQVTKIPILKLQEKQNLTLVDGINENQVIEFLDKDFEQETENPRKSTQRIRSLRQLDSYQLNKPQFQNRINLATDLVSQYNLENQNLKVMENK